MSTKVTAPSAKYVALVALPIVKAFRARYAEYLEECDEARKSGFRPHYCEHGTNQWTDYDNICYGCEEGITNAPYGVHKNAIEYAHEYIRRSSELAEGYRQMRQGVYETMGNVPVQFSSEVLDHMGDKFIEYFNLINRTHYQKEI